MKELENLKTLPKLPTNESLIGLVSMFKVTEKGGTQAFMALSDLDLDTDGVKDPGIHYESTNQSQTTIDPLGKWCNSNKLNFIVLPDGFNKRHGNTCQMGTLATVIYKNKVAHCIVADIGPKAKFGEGSIALHRALGFERVKPSGHIQDVGIDGGVLTLIYFGRKIGKTPVIQADINKACAPLWEKFTK